jgi:UDP-glucose 4-epimerase
MKVLITGGAGFAGSGLVGRLLEKGHRVTVLDFVAPLMSGHNLDKIDYIWKGLQDIQPSDVKGQDIIIHLAAQADVPMGLTSPKWTVEQNVMGAICLLEACKHLKFDRIIYAGSGNEWGRPIRLPIDENHPLTPHNPYAFSKAAAELAFEAYGRCYNLPIVRMSNGACCGAGMRKEIFIYKWLRNIMLNKEIVLEGGDQTRDLTYVSDILDAWMLTINAPRSKVIGQKFQVSYGKEVSVEDLMNMCLKECDENPKTYPIDRRPYRPGEKGQRELFDNSKARKVLGYRPKVGPEEAIHLTAKWVGTTLDV